MQLDRCQQLGCTLPPHYLVINTKDGKVVSAFCKKDGDAANNIPGYLLQEIPHPQNFPLGKPGKKGELMAQGQNPATASIATAPPSALAPSDAVYDEDEPEGPGIEFMEEQQQITPPSADHASTNFFWKYGKDDIFELQTTLRGYLSEEQVNMHIDMMMKSMLQVYNRGGRPRLSANPVTTTTATGSMTTGPAAPAPAAPPPAAASPGSPAPSTPAPPPAGGKNPSSVVVSRMVIEPRPDGKSRISFYCTGDQYPRIYTVQDPTNLAAMLSKCGAWTEEHLTQAKEYAVHYKVSWVDSDKLNTKGKPYKNITEIAPA